jgi:hypothetical protein
MGPRRSVSDGPANPPQPAPGLPTVVEIGCNADPAECYETSKARLMMLKATVRRVDLG